MTVLLDLTKAQVTLKTIALNTSKNIEKIKRNGSMIFRATYKAYYYSYFGINCFRKTKAFINWHV